MGAKDTQTLINNQFQHPALTLTLLVTWLSATNNANHTLTSNNFAVTTHFFNRCSNFHFRLPKKFC